MVWRCWLWELSGWKIRLIAFNGEIRILTKGVGFPALIQLKSLPRKTSKVRSLNKFNEYWPEWFLFLARREERSVSAIHKRRATTLEIKIIWYEFGLGRFLRCFFLMYRRYNFVGAPWNRLNPNSPISRCIYSETAKLRRYRTGNRHRWVRRVASGERVISP